MIKEFLYSEVKVMAERLENGMEFGGMDCEEALRMVLEDADGIMVRPDCRFTFCDHGMGLAGGSGCPGDPANANCKEFTQKYSEEAENATRP